MPCELFFAYMQQLLQTLKSVIQNDSLPLNISLLHSVLRPFEPERLPAHINDHSL